jgi:outer membrane receptor for ferrienterochelin and colicins
MHYCPGGFRYTIRHNPDISPEKSSSANLDIEHRRGNVVMQLNLFRTDVRDLIQGEVVGKDEEANRLEYMYVNVGKARTQGIESHIGVQLGLGLSISAGYAYLDAKDIDADEWLPFRSRHTADWSVRYEHCQWDLDVDLSGELVGSMLTQSVGEDDEGNEIVTEGQSPDYTIWNAKISKRMMKNYKIFFGVDNLFDYVQRDWTTDTEYIWGPLRGQFVYGGFTVQF